MNLPELLSDLTIHYNALIRKIAAQHNLTSSQAFNLLAIPHDGISMSKLSFKLGLNTSTLTRNIQKLEALGLIKRTKDSYDKRIQRLSLSEKGYTTLSDLEASIEKLNHSILDQIDLDNQVNLINILENLVWAIECIRER